MKRITLVTLLAMLTGSVQAADVASDVQTGSGGIDNRNGGYFEFGVGSNFFLNRERATLNTVPFMAGAYRRGGFFLEAVSPGIRLNDGAVGGITAGYTIWRNNRWSADLLGVSSRWRLSRQSLNIDDSDPGSREQDRNLLQRDSFYNGAGIRLTGSFGNTLFQYRLVNDTLGNGETSSARIAYSRQVRNWNFHGVLGLQWVSRETSQYWYGVTDEEVTPRFEPYDINGPTISYSAEVGGTFPVRESVVFRTTMRYAEFDSAIADSPLQESEFSLTWNTSLSYVF